MRDRTAYNAKNNTPERVLARGTRLVLHESGWHTAVKLTRGEREYFAWLLSERARRAV